MAQRSAWGTVRQSDRRGYCEIRYWADTGDGKGYRRHSQTVRGSRRDARRILSELWLRYGDDRPCATMARAYLEWWLPMADARLEEGLLARSTYDLYAGTWRNHVEPRWGSVPIDDIKPADVQEWLLGLSKWTAVIAKSLGNLIAEKAVLMEGAKRNPFALRYDMPSKGEDRDRSIWTLAQISSAAEQVRGTVVEVPLILCGLGSCRVGESCAARADEVELTVEQGMRVARIPIVRQLLRGGVSDKLKNRQSVRTVCIPEPWSLRIEEIARGVLAEGGVWLNDNGFREPVSRSVVKRTWARTEFVGMERVTLQNLRSSWETFMRWELGVDGDLIDAMMGHAGDRIRTQHYDRPAPDVFAETCALAHLGRFKK